MTYGIFNIVPSLILPSLFPNNQARVLIHKKWADSCRATATLSETRTSTETISLLYTSAGNPFAFVDYARKNPNRGDWVCYACPSVGNVTSRPVRMYWPAYTFNERCIPPSRRNTALTSPSKTRPELSASIATGISVKSISPKSSLVFSWFYLSC